LLRAERQRIRPHALDGPDRARRRRQAPDGQGAAVDAEPDELALDGERRAGGHGKGTAGASAHGVLRLPVKLHEGRQARVKQAPEECAG
jgi:hypothetical protein